MGIISRFAGLIDAAAYAYGIVPDAPAALQVITGSTTAGTFTVTCQASQNYASNAVKSVPSTNTPITIGYGLNIETVTPSAVSFDTLGNILITATFAYAHGAGDVVRSGTVGLQEALNYAAGAGGGAVVITPGWAQYGGTSAMLTARQPSNDGSLYELFSLIMRRRRFLKHQKRRAVIIDLCCPCQGRRLFHQQLTKHIMTTEQKMNEIKRLETLVAFQKDCLSGGDMDTFDRVENEIKKLEETIILEA